MWWACSGAAGQCRRSQPAGELCRHPQRDAAAPPRPAVSPLRGFHRSRFGEEAASPAVTYALPVFDLRSGEVTSHFSLTYIEAAEMAGTVPKLTPAQREALDLLLALAEELSFDMTLEAGDMQSLNNHVIYHARTAFTDGAGEREHRLLYRLWLSTPNSRECQGTRNSMGHDGREGAARHRTGTRDAPKTKVWGGSVVTDNCAILPSFVQLNAVIFHILTDGRRSELRTTPVQISTGNTTTCGIRRCLSMGTKGTSVRTSTLAANLLQYLINEDCHRAVIDFVLNFVVGAHGYSALC